MQDVFGGDPDKGRVSVLIASFFNLMQTTVTIFGESAGAYSIDALLTSYGHNERPPFRGAILQSGQLSFKGVGSRDRSNCHC
jgi:hypothetical protein